MKCGGEGAVELEKHISDFDSGVLTRTQLASELAAFIREGYES